ncbi:MAG TPA: metallophosphoesterase family protein [Longimicrobiales bacterium]
MDIGLISDTHGRLRPEVFERFRAVEHILHAGDVGSADVLAELEVLAPVTAVWGNTDGFDLRSRLPETARLELQGCRILVVHGHQLGSPTAAGLVAAYPGFDVIVYGHTHRPQIERGAGVLVVNPGAAGPARFGLPPSVAVLTLSTEGPRATVLPL